MLKRRFCLWVLLMIVMGCSAVLPATAQDGGTRLDQGAAFLAANNIPPEAFVELSATIGDPAKAAEVLVKYGYTPTQAQAFMTPQNVFTMASVLNPSPANEVVGQAMGILAPYNLSMADLTALMPNLSNPQAMVATLMQKGLTQQQASDLLTSAAPLIQQASETGMLQYAVINDQVGAMLSQSGFNVMLMYQMGNIINDPEAMAAYMQANGYTDAQIQTFQGMAQGMAAQGITPELLEGWTVKNMVYRMEGIGLDPTAISEIVGLGNIDAVKDYLTDMGLSGSALDLALANIQGCLGENGEVLDSERLEAFQAGEAARLLNGAGIDPADLGDILALGDDPDAMGAYLADMYGLAPDQIAAFEKGLANSTFAKTVDPDDAEDFITNVEMEAEDMSGDGMTDDSVGDDAADDSGGDDAADDSAGDGMTDDSAGDGTADDSAGDDAADDSAGDGMTDDSAGDAADDSGGGDDAADDSAGDGTADDSGGDAADDSGGD